MFILSEAKTNVYYKASEKGRKRRTDLEKFTSSEAKVGGLKTSECCL